MRIPIKQHKLGDGPYEVYRQENEYPKFDGMWTFYVEGPGIKVPLHRFSPARCIREAILMNLAWKMRGEKDKILKTIKLVTKKK